MAKAGYIHISTITMDGIYWSFQMITVFLTYVAGRFVYFIIKYLEMFKEELYYHNAFVKVPRS